MKAQFLALALGLTFAQASYATGGFSCSGEDNGKKYEIFGCVPHSIPGLCSDVTVLENSKEIFVIARDKVPAFYVSGNFLGLIGMDANYNENLVSLEYFGAKDKRNSLKIKTPAGASVEVKGKQVTCELE